MRRNWIPLILVLLCEAAYGKIVLPGAMSDSMVLQRNTQASIYGKADPGKTVSIRTSWDKKTYRVTPGADSLWMAEVNTTEAGGPYQVEIRQGGSRVVINDVLLGEVWLCSGQSNMQVPVMGLRSQPVEGSFEALIDAPSHRNIRLLHAPRELRQGKQFDVNAKWEKASITSVSTFSAIGYFYAIRLADALGVPVGIIESDWGGTRIESWMERERARKIFPEVSEGDDVNKIQAMYDCLIWPFHNYTVKGFLWYQGESNSHYPELYPQLMAEMVSNWRSIFHGKETKPFYYVMLAPFDYNHGGATRNNVPYEIVAPLMWEAQIKALKLIEDSDIANTVDLGQAEFIHPGKKRQVADRLVMLALHHTYGDKGGYDSASDTMAWNGPMYKGVEFLPGKAIVEFDSPSTLFPAEPFKLNAPIYGFELAGEDRVFHKADARVLMKEAYDFSRKVEVSCPEVPNPVAVRYAFHNVPETNLTNSQGIPAFPFRTDNWDDNPGCQP